MGNILPIQGHRAAVRRFDAHDHIEGGGFDPEGFECTAGLDGVRIEVDGSLRRAGCQWCGKEENWLGNLITGEYTLPTEPINTCSNINTRLFLYFSSILEEDINSVLLLEIQV